jgi:serine protease AprX
MQILIIVIFIVSLLGPAALPVQAGADKAHPALLKLAFEDPAQQVAVIVQKLAQDSHLEKWVAAHSGKVTKDLSIINAFAAQMSAGTALELARSPQVRWVSLDAPVQDSSGPDGPVNTSQLLNTYNRAINADDLWNDGYQGSSVTVAVIDSGMSKHNDIKARIVDNVKTNSYPVTTNDSFGHGTHIAGIIGGNGTNSNGSYIGVAPKVNLINVKVTDDQGMGLMSDVVAGAQWVFDNRVRYNIRIVNLSLNSTVVESYHVNPLNAALEILWFNGVVVVVSAGNNGSNQIYPPANDPFVITVGAADDKGTPGIADDTLAAFSAFGTTTDGYSKPDIIAPGKDIISLLASNSCSLSVLHPDHRVSGANTYFRMSGTSMAAGVTTGAIALLLQDEPNLNPDQVKYRLMASAQPFSAGNGAGYLDAYAAVTGTTSETANTNINASQLLWTGAQPITWNSVSWNSVSWNSVSWNSVSWNSVSWNSVSWNSVYWGQ